jgi:hypothetical protein
VTRKQPGSLRVTVYNVFLGLFRPMHSAMLAILFTHHAVDYFVIHSSPTPAISFEAQASSYASDLQGGQGQLEPNQWTTAR